MAFKNAILELFEDFITLIYPQYCFACNGSLLKSEAYICTDCRVKLPYTGYHLLETEAENPLARRFWGKVEIKYALAYLRFSNKGRVQRLLHKLKYQGEQEIGILLGHWYGSALAGADLAKAFDLIIPVPLHKTKERKRGYNQAACFAAGLSESMHIPSDTTSLVRIKNTDTQTRKDRLERWQNVEEIFKLHNPDKLKGKRILLVDDVLTTGSTLEACALTLLKGGCREVSIATIAAA